MFPAPPSKGSPSQPDYRSQRGHAALRRGRSSAPGAEYFLTICTRDRAGSLLTADLASAITKTMDELSNEGAWHIRTGTIMPDHVHLFVTLGLYADLSAAVRLVKGRLSPLLRKEGLGWERSYFDHRMRETEDRLPVFLYIFLNPYRAGLLKTGERWPLYGCSESDRVWFEPLTASDCPFPEWLQ